MRYIHLTTEDAARRCRRHGIRPNRRGSVFLMPETGDPMRSAQWVRELRKWNGGRRLVAVVVDIPAETLVLAGRYGGGKEEMTAAQAYGALLRRPASDGFEVELRGRVEAHQVRAIRPVAQVVGWRHFPEAHGRAPLPWSTRGEPNSRRIREGRDAKKWRRLAAKARAGGAPTGLLPAVGDQVRIVLPRVRSGFDAAINGKIGVVQDINHEWENPIRVRIDGDGWHVSPLEVVVVR